MNAPKPPYTASELEHFGRIGDSLLGAARAIMEREPKECPPKECPPKERASPAPILPGNVADLITDGIERQIVQYLQAHVECTRRGLRSALGLSNATIARKITRLRAAGIIVSTGNTNGAYYSLRGSDSSN